MKTLSWPKASGEPSPAKPKETSRLKIRQKILVADEETPFARQLADYMGSHGFDVRPATTVQEAKQLIEFWQPDTVFVSLLLPVTNALSLLKFVNSGRLKKAPKMIVMSKQSQSSSVEQIKRAGAAHFLIKPFEMEEAFRAVTLTGDEKTGPRAGLELGPSTIRELHLLNLFLRQATAPVQGEASLFNLMRMINIKVKAIRCSLIQVMDEDLGRVLASNDDERVHNLEIDLKVYPDIREVRRTLSHVVVANVKTAELMREGQVRQRLGKTPFETIVLFPVFRCGTFFGVLSLRMQQRDPIEIFYVEKFGQVCSQIISLAIGTPGQRLVAE